MRWLSLLFVLVIIGCSGKSSKSNKGSTINKDSISNTNIISSKNPDTIDYFSKGVTRVVRGLRHTFALNKYNVGIGESVKIYYKVKNIQDTTVIFSYNCGLQVEVLHDSEIIYHPLYYINLYERMNLKKNEEKLFGALWMQTNIVDMKPGSQVPAGSYKIRAYLPGKEFPKLETTLVINK
jgi:hypothetical protein